MPTTAAEVRAAEIFDALDINFSLPPVTLTSAEYLLPTHLDNPLYTAVHKVDLADLTTGAVGGTGSFEVLMASMKEHLKGEFDKGRITGDQYTKAYVELTNLAMSTGLQFTMGQELAYWQAAGAREQAKALEIASVTAAVMLETAKAQLAMQRYQAELAQAQYVLTKLQLSSEDARYRLAVEQIEAAHSQHSDTKTDDTTPVAGTIKRQRDLLEEQREAFIRAADATVGKMYLDAWLTQLTINEGSTPPDQMTAVNINQVMLKMRERASLV